MIPNYGRRMTLDNPIGFKMSPKLDRSTFQQTPLSRGMVQTLNEEICLNEEINQEERDKLKAIFQKIQKIKEEKRVHNLVMNLPTRMLKSFDQNKFELLNDKGYVYNEHSFQDSIYKYNKLKSINERENQFQLNKKKTYGMSQFNTANKQTNRENTNAAIFEPSPPNDLSDVEQKPIFNISYYLNLVIFNSLKNIFKIIMDSIPIIQPSNPVKLIWDLGNMMITIICMYFLPISMVFNFPFSRLLSIELLFIIPTFLVLDIIINLNTGYFEKGQVITIRFQIICKYFKKNFITDIISVFPFVISLLNEISQIYNNPDGDVDVNNNTFPKILFLPFFLKGISLSSALKKIEERFNLPRILTNLIQLAKLLFTIILINHLFACLWVYAAHLEIENGNNKTWMTSAGIQNSEWTKQYLVAFYFTTVTMITVGYGDILPRNNLEYILCVITMMLACGVFGYSLNEVGSIFSNFFQVDNEIKKKVSLIQRFMSKKNINSKLQFQIREYLEYCWRESAETNQEEEQNIIEQLSESLRSKLLFEANKIVLRDSPIFKHNFSKNVIEQTVPLIQEIKYSPESLICQKGVQDDQAIYFIENGSVDIVLNLKQKKSQSLLRLQKGDSFGAQSFFTGLPRINNVRSNEFTTVLKIRRQDFLQLISDYSEDQETFCSIRDSISYLSDYSKIGMKCQSCNSNYHMINDCQYLHYIPNKARVIKGYNDSNNNNCQRVYSKRRSNNIHYHYRSSRKIFSEVIRQVQMFLEQNESMLNLSEDDSQFTDGYYNTDTDKEPSTRTDLNQNEDERESNQRFFSNKNIGQRQEKESNSSQKIIHIEDKGLFLKQKSIEAQQIEHQYNQSIQNLMDLQKPNISIPLNLKKTQNQAIASFNQIISIENCEELIENVSSNNQIQQSNSNIKNKVRNRSTTELEEDPSKSIAHQDRFKKSKTALNGGQHSYSNYQQKQNNFKLDNNNPQQKNQFLENYIKPPPRVQSMNDKLKQKTQQLNKKDSENQLDEVLKHLQLLCNQNQQNEQQESNLNANDTDLNDIFLYFDKMKQFIKYKPRYNFSSVISRFCQKQDSQRKVIRSRKQHRLSRKKNTQLTKTQHKFLDQTQSQADQRIFTKLQQSSIKNQSTNPVLDNSPDNYKIKQINNIILKKCESDFDPIKDTQYKMYSKENNQQENQMQNRNENSSHRLNMSGSISQLVQSIDNCKKNNQKLNDMIIQSQSLENTIFWKDINKDELIFDDDDDENNISKVMPKFLNIITNNNISKRQQFDN